MMFRSFVVLMAAGASLAVAADIRVIEEVAVKVNGDIVTRGELAEQRRETEMYLRQEQKLTGPALAAALEEQSKDMLRDKIDELLLVQKAKDMSLNVDSEVIRRLGQMQVEAQKADPKLSDPEKFHDYIAQATGMPFEDFKAKLTNSFLTHRVISQEIGSRIAIPEADLRKYYDEHKSEFVRKEPQVFLSQIVISTEGKTPEQVANAEAKAKDIAARAKKGEKFTDLVAANSDDVETAKNGGSLPPLQPDQLFKPIADIVTKQRKGFVTDPIKIPQGFVIVRIDDRYEAGQASFDEVKDQIQEALATPRMTPKIREYLTRLRQQAFLEIRDGYVDTGAAPGKDTRWHDVAQLKPQTVTKEEVASRRKKKRFLHLIPYGSSTPKQDIDTSQLGQPKEKEPAPAQEAPAAAPTVPPVKK